MYVSPSESPFNRNYLVTPSYLSYSHAPLPIYSQKLIGFPRQYYHHNLDIWKYHDSRLNYSTDLHTSRTIQDQFNSFNKSIALERNYYDGSNYLCSSRTVNNPFLRKSLINPSYKLIEQLEFDLSKINNKNKAETSRVNLDNSRDTLNKYKDLTTKDRSTSFQENSFKNAEKKQEIQQKQKEAERGHKSTKQEIKVRGQKFYKAQVHRSTNRE